LKVISIWKIQHFFYHIFKNQGDFAWNFLFCNSTRTLYFLSPSFHRFNYTHMILRTLATRLTNLKNLHVNLKILLPQISCSSKFFVCDMTKFLYYCSYLWKTSTFILLSNLKVMGCCVIKILIFIFIKSIIFWGKMITDGNNFFSFLNRTFHFIIH